MRRHHAVSAPAKDPLILVLVENLPLPGDRRVWLECTALRDTGYRVAAITPKGRNDPGYQNHEGVHLYKYAPPAVTSGLLSFVWEFLYCWVMTAWLTIKVIRRHGRPAVVQTCNPPDTFWALALLLRPFGTKFVFDQHDLCPEVFESKFHKRGPAHKALLALEGATYRTAHHVISTNESYRQIAMSRGHVPAERVSVVRTGPDTSALYRREPDPGALRGFTYLVHYHGVMGPQDGVDIVLDAIRDIVAGGRTDTFFNVMGGGDEHQALRARVTEYGLDEYVYMPGRVPDEELFASMSNAVVGLSPDPPGPLNDISTMNKTMEYMAFGLPVLTFDLHETRVSAEGAAEYVAEASAEAYAAALTKLLDNPTRREEMAREGVRRAREVLDWRTQRPTYLSLFARLAPLAPTHT